MATTLKSAGVIIDEERGSAMPCELEVDTADRRPVRLTTPSFVSDGRYKLLAPNWTADAIRLNGAWEITNHAAHQTAELSPKEKRAAEKKLKKMSSNDPILAAAIEAAKRAEGLRPDNDPPKQKRRLF